MFWQTQGEIEEQRTGTPKQQLGAAKIDVLSGAVAGQVVAYFIIITTSATLFIHNQSHYHGGGRGSRTATSGWSLARYLFAVGLVGVRYCRDSGVACQHLVCCRRCNWLAVRSLETPVAERRLLPHFDSLDCGGCWHCLAGHQPDQTDFLGKHHSGSDGPFPGYSYLCWLAITGQS